jgi:YidC/Oxa1 family membrane protein insertase
LATLTLFLGSFLVHFYGLFHDWGSAIIALTMILRVLLFPIQFFNLTQQRKLQKIQPELNQVAETWKAEPSRLFKESQIIKKKHGIRTGFAFLATVLPIPIFLGIYRTMSSLHAFVGAPFLWIANLGSPDPWFLLPALVALVAYAQQRLNPTTKAGLTAPMKTVLRLMPAMSFVFMLAMPSCLVLYYAVSGFLQLAGDVAIKRFMI